MQEISCIKDGITGVCRDLKDKKAREDIAVLQDQVKDLGAVDLSALQRQIDSLNELTTYLNESQNTQGAFFIEQININRDLIEGEGQTRSEETSALDTRLTSVENSVESVENSITEHGARLTSVENSVESVEKYELIYDQDTQNIINGTAYTSGLQPTTKAGSSYAIDVSKYDFLEVYFHLNKNIGGNTAGGKIVVDLTKVVNTGTCPYIGITIFSGLYHGFVATEDEDYCRFVCQVSADKQLVLLRNALMKMNTPSSIDYGRATYYRIIGGTYGYID